jgi:hypothetical protein
MDQATPVPPGGELACPQGEPTASYLDSSEEWEGETPDRGAAGQRPSAQPAPVGDALTPPPEPGPRPERPAGLSAPPSAWGSTFTGRIGGGRAAGVARSVQVRGGENSALLFFRVDQYDAAGNRMEPVGVEVQNYQSGQVSDGDEVEVTGSWHRGTLRAERVVNRTTGAEIKGLSRRLMKTLAVLIGLFFLGWFIFLIILGTTS